MKGQEVVAATANIAFEAGIDRKGLWYDVYREKMSQMQRQTLFPTVELIAFVSYIYAICCDSDSFQNHRRETKTGGGIQRSKTSILL